MRCSFRPLISQCCWQGAWYAEFVFLYYRITIAALSVLVGSSANAQLCLVLMALATAGLLAFVLLVKPFDDGSHTSPEMLTSADKAQAHSLGATLVASAIGFVCLLSPGRGAGSNVLAGLVVGVVGVTPLAVGLYEQRKASKEEEGDGSVPSDEGQDKSEEKRACSYFDFSFFININTLELQIPKNKVNKYRSESSKTKRGRVRARILISHFS